MIDGAYELESAAAAIEAEPLQAAISAIAIGCQEYLRWTEVYSQRLQTVAAADMHKFARSLALSMLGHLPTRPETCPFCIQYGRDRSCQGCGYAQTHGRCDSEASAFSRFIEAFVEMGRAIYQDISMPRQDPRETRKMLQTFLSSSREAAILMMADLPSASTLQLMGRKAWYLDRMISLIPLSIFSEDVAERCKDLREALSFYW